MRRHFQNISVRSLVLMAVLSLSAPALAGDINSDGVDDGIVFADRNNDGCHDNWRAFAYPERNAHDILIISDTNPRAFFGFYLARQMTEPGWTLLRRTIDWADGQLQPEQADVLLFTYNNDLEWPVDYVQEDGFEVYTYLISQGYNVTGHHQWDMLTLDPEYYRSFDIVIYWNTYCYDPSKALASGVPLISTCTGHGEQMNLLQGWFSSYRESFCVIDNSHYPAASFDRGGISFQGGMWVEGGRASGEDVSVIADVCFSGYLDIKPGSCPNPLNTTPFENKKDKGKAKKGGVLPVAILGTATFDVSQIDVSTVRLKGVGPLRYDYEDVTAPVVDGEGCECTTVGPDGYADLTLKFQKSEVVAALGTVSKGDVVPVTLTGQLKDGTPFDATDCVTMVNGEPEGVDSSRENKVVLGPAVPNPFNPTTTISFTLPERMRVTLAIYDVQGRLVKTLVDETVGEGYQERTWDGKDSRGNAVSSGVYFYRLTAGDRTLTKKMVLLR